MTSLFTIHDCREEFYSSLTDTHKNVQAIPAKQQPCTKIKPANICTHQELATVITVGYAHPRKFIPSKI